VNNSGRTLMKTADVNSLMNPTSGRTLSKNAMVKMVDGKTLMNSISERTSMKTTDGRTLMKDNDDSSSVKDNNGRTLMKNNDGKTSMEVTSVSITNVDTNKIFIRIGHKDGDINNPMFRLFLSLINNLIGSKTTVNYNITPVYESDIYIPIFPYTAHEMKMDVEDLVNLRVKTITNYLETFNWKLTNKTIRWCARSLMKSKINVFQDLEITVLNDNEHYPMNSKINVMMPSMSEEIKVKRIVGKDNSRITFMIDPLSVNYGIFVDFSVPFNEMGYSFNALHLYEHLLTKMWKNVTSEDVIDLNGATFPTGISYIYSVHSSLKSFREHINAAMNWIFKSRNPKFWETQEMKDDIEMETIRTISETRIERTMNSMGRSDSKAFGLNYDINIFKYWANKPFNLLVTVQSEDDWKLSEVYINELIDKYKINKVETPKNVKFDRIPIEVFRSKKSRHVTTKKMDLMELKKQILTNDIPKSYLYGIDNVFVCTSSNISKLNNLLFPLLFVDTSVEELQTYLENHIVPMSSTFFTSVSLTMKNSEDLLENMIDY